LLAIYNQATGAGVPKFNASTNQSSSVSVNLFR
jgi:hypothetical protein